MTTLTAYRNLTVLPPHSPVFEKKLRLLPLNEIYKGNNIIVYFSVPYNTFPKTSTNNAPFTTISTIKMQNHQIKFISLIYGQL